MFIWCNIQLSGPDPDDLLDQGYTDAQGMFNLKGDTAELTTIDPVFKVYHDCDDGVKVLFLLDWKILTMEKTNLILAFYTHKVNVRLEKLKHKTLC